MECDTHLQEQARLEKDEAHRQFQLDAQRKLDTKLMLEGMLA